MASNAEMVDYIWPISTNYVFGGSRYEPYDTDCSGMMCAAMWHVHGVDPYTLGDWTGAQWSWGVLSKVWWGQTPYLPWDIMQKGDFIFTSTVAPSFNTGENSHVGLYTGDPNAPFLSHFANGGPYVTAVNGVYGGNERYYGVARYVPGSEDDVSAQDVWDYGLGTDATPGYKNEPAWKHLSWCHHDTAAMYADICQKDMSAAEKETGEKVNTGVGMHERLAYCEGYIKQINKKLDKLKVSGATIDYDKLAEAVAKKTADTIYARMKA